MGNPITNLWHLAESGFKKSADFFASEWRALYDSVTLQDFEDHVRQAFFRLAQVVEFSVILSADSIRDAMVNGENLATNTRTALQWLRWTIIPEYAGHAYEQAVAYALALYFRLDSILTGRIAVEHKAMMLRVLQEELARLVEVADVWARLHTEIAIERNDRILADAHLDSVLTQRIAAAKQQVLSYVDQVRAQLAAQIAQVLKYAQSIPGLVDSEAAKGYDPTLSAHASTLTRLFDAAVAHEPLIASVVSRLARWLVDLAEVDNPLIRIAAQLILKELIDRLGLDTALGKLLNGLLGPVLAGGPPKTLTAVTRQVGDRLNGAETGLAALAPLGPEADALHEMGTVAFDVALLGYLSAAVANPVAWADDTHRALAPVVDSLFDPVTRLLGAL